MKKFNAFFSNHEHWEVDSNLDFLNELKPDNIPFVQNNSSNLFDESLLTGKWRFGKRDDELICRWFSQEIEKYDLLPNWETFYILDIWLPHIPALQQWLLSWWILPYTYINPSEQRIKNETWLFSQYLESSLERSKSIANWYKTIKDPKGFCMLMDSHADKYERNFQNSALPSIELLKMLGIKKLVIWKETYYESMIKVKDLEYFWKEYLFLNDYAKLAQENWIDVSIIWIDYRYNPVANPDYNKSQVKFFPKK